MPLTLPFRWYPRQAARSLAAGAFVALGLWQAASPPRIAAQEFAPAMVAEAAAGRTDSVAERLEQLQGQVEVLQQDAYSRGVDDPHSINAALLHQPPTAGPTVDRAPPDTGAAARPPAAVGSTDSAQPKYPNVTINGVFQADVGFFGQDAQSQAAFGDIQDGADFRRARLSARGSVTETVNYFFQMDFASFGRPTFTDVWLESTDHPLLGNIRIGQWKQPFSLEVVSSFRYTTFMERSLLFQPFTPFRHLGVGFYDNSEDLNWTWAASGFRSGQDQFGGSISDNGGWGTAERITYLPWYDEDSGGRGYLHLGAGHFLNVPPNNRFNFRTIPELYIGENAPGVVGTSGQAAPGAFNGTPFFVETGALPLDHFNVLGSELLYVYGAFSFQSEAMVCYADQQQNSNLVFPGFYAQVGYFLTGEHRPYDRKMGTIDRVKPLENFFNVGTPEGMATGWGAWEIAGRVSTINLNDDNVRGGSMTDLTAGVNWYWNPYTKLVFNYIHSRVQDPTHGQANTDMVAARAQIDF
jgi:phosphate-selective porin OprO/OprP